MPDQVDSARPPLWLAAMRLQDGALIEDLTCTACGYNLRGLTLEGLCPECGTDVSRSIQGDLLRFAEPAWLVSVQQGAKRQLWAVVFFLLAIVFMVVGETADRTSTYLAVFTSLALWVGWLVPDIAASFWLTAPEHRPFLTDENRTLRLVIRAGAILATGGAASMLAAPVFRSLILVAAGALLFALGAVRHLPLLVYLRRLARRIPNGRLALLLTALFWGLLICFVLVGVSLVAYVVADVWHPLFRPSTKADFYHFILVVQPVCGWVGSVGIVIMALAYLPALYRFRAACTEALGLARLQPHIHSTAPVP